MDKETLERLLMDRALGALPGDVETLLAAYLKHDVASAARAREFDTAAGVAREILKQEIPASLPPFPRAAVHKLERTRRQLVWIRNAASLAACVVIGVGLGAWLSPSANRRPSPNPGPARIALTSVNHPDAAHAGASDFWSARRLVEQARQTRRGDPQRVIWDSPVSSPKLGGAS